MRASPALSISQIYTLFCVHFMQIWRLQASHHTCLSICVCIPLQNPDSYFGLRCVCHDLLSHQIQFPTHLEGHRMNCRLQGSMRMALSGYRMAIRGSGGGPCGGRRASGRCGSGMCASPLSATTWHGWPMPPLSSQTGAVQGLGLSIP